jgi:Kef-type K+ transport systems, membrane components
VVVVEIPLGPQVFDIARTDSFIEFFANLGFGMLFFFAGYEIDFQRIKGRPIELGGIGWLLSAGLAYGIGGVLAAAGIIDSFLHPGSAMATTAIGTLIPILRDNGELKTNFGTTCWRRRGRRVLPGPPGHALPLDRPPAARGADS